MEKLPEMSMANIGHNFCSGCSTYGAHEFKGVNMNYELVSNYRVNFTWEEELTLNPSTDSNEIVYSAYVMYSDKDQFETEAKKLDVISKKNGEFWYGEKPVSLFDKPYNYKIKRIQFVGGNGAMVLYRGFKIRYFPD
ncbi:hypothetical protein GCM10023091_21520 [Ravibacter arvi]|uniref:Uncharacterized protein n=1 Tax=Ravibacter arvi TaxID=2051041 RepID=A0ABP8LZH0_9BACT